METLLLWLILTPLIVLIWTGCALALWIGYVIYKEIKYDS